MKINYFDICIMLFVFSIAIGCSNKNNEMVTLNGQQGFYWQNESYKQTLNQWVNHDIQVMLVHPDFVESQYMKIPISHHVNLYNIQTEIWRYSPIGLNISKKFVIHVFTKKDGTILAISVPMPSK